MNEVESTIQLELYKIDGGNIKATIIDCGEVVISTTSQFQHVVFEQHSSTNAIKIVSQFDEHGRERECYLVYMTEYELDCINDPINRQHSFELKKQNNTDDDLPLLPPPLIRDQPFIIETYFTESRFRELTLGTIEDGLPLVAPVYIRTANT